MPTRYLKPGIRDSELIDSLSPMAEVMFYRLLVTVDDFGRFDARPTMLKSHCFPVKEKITAKHCEEYLKELAEAGLVVVYQHENKPYMQVCKWDNVPRSKESKYPAYEDGCIQMYTSVCSPSTVLPVTGTVTKTETETDQPDGFVRFWDEWPKNDRKQDKRKCLAKWKADKLEAIADQIVQDVSMKKTTDKWKAGYVEAPLVYLNNKRWDDGVITDLQATQESERWSTRGGVESIAKELGLPLWSQAEHWETYKRRIENAYQQRALEG